MRRLGRVFELRGTLKDLAAELGLTHEALYRTLAALERPARSGAITAKSRCYAAYDRDHMLALRVKLFRALGA